MAASPSILMVGLAWSIEWMNEWMTHLIDRASEKTHTHTIQTLQWATDSRRSCSHSSMTLIYWCTIKWYYVVLYELGRCWTLKPTCMPRQRDNNGGSCDVKTDHPFFSIRVATWKEMQQKNRPSQITWLHHVLTHYLVNIKTAVAAHWNNA